VFCTDCGGITFQKSIVTNDSPCNENTMALIKRVDPGLSEEVEHLYRKDLEVDPNNAINTDNVVESRWT